MSRDTFSRPEKKDIDTSKARDVLHQAMRPALYRHICKKIKIASIFPTFVVVIDSVVANNLR